MANQNEITIIKDKTFETIQRAVNKMVDMIRPTFGPASNKVIIESPMYFSPLTVDDGVQIARDFKLDDSAENAIVKVVRETAVRTNDRVGDGTTGSLIILQAIINELARKSKFDGHKVSKELKKACEEARVHLEKSAKQIKTKAELKKTAMVSFDNEEMAETLSDLFFKLGKDATITIEKSQTMKTKVEMSDGVTIERGYISPYMINNPERMESHLDKPYILLTEYRITENSDILPILEKIVKHAAEHREPPRPLVIIAENVELQALATLIQNNPWVKTIQPNGTASVGLIGSCAINLPAVEDRKVFLEDLGIMTGATVFSNEKGNNLKDATLEDLGRADKFISRKDESVIVGPKGDKKLVTGAVDALRKLVADEPNEAIKKTLGHRLGRFTNSLAVIKVGAPTDNEQKSLKYKIEDAVSSVKLAFKHGVVCGGGMALARIKTSSPLLNEALKYPSRQLMENMGLDETLDLSSNEALNVITGEKGEFMEVGVIDPVSVLIAAVESAVSIASLLITASGIICESPRVKE